MLVTLLSDLFWPSAALAFDIIFNKRRYSYIKTQNIWCRNKSRRMYKTSMTRGWCLWAESVLVLASCKIWPRLTCWSWPRWWGWAGWCRAPRRSRRGSRPAFPLLLLVLCHHILHQQRNFQFHIYYVFNIPCPFSPAPSSNDAQKASTVKWAHQLLRWKFGQILHTTVLSQAFIQLKIQSQCASQQATIGGHFLYSSPSSYPC